MKANIALINLGNAIRRHGQPVCMTSDPEAWFPDKGNLDRANKMAIEHCRQCPVQRECLIYALTANEPYGIYGGLTAQERRKLKKKSPPVTTGTSESRNEQPLRAVIV